MVGEGFEGPALHFPKFCSSRPCRSQQISARSATQPQPLSDTTSPVHVRRPHLPELLEHCLLIVRGDADSGVADQFYASASIRARASLRSAVSKPSVNQLYTGASKS